MISWLIVLTLTIGACGLADEATPPPEIPSLPTPAPTQPLPEAMVTFRVQLPDNTPSGQKTYLNILDEVTGLALNVTPHEMKARGPLTYELGLPLPVGATIKYRYAREATYLAEEHTSTKRPVRYRLYHVEGPGVVEDVVSAWSDTAFQSETGRIIGHATDSQSGSPIPNLLITAGGAVTLSGSDGSFLIEGLPPGTHNLVAYAMDGAYRTFQQNALVAAHSATPAEIRLTSAPQVSIAFTVTTPPGTLPAVPIRLAGNLAQLGNTFADLSGGVSTLASRMPALSPLPDGRYSLALMLPAGAFVQYKYTLGDGFWNAEHTLNGEFRVRRLIVPETSTIIEDKVDSWGSGKMGPIIFNLSVPAETPASDSISIQFNPYSWTESLPMWPLGDNRWAYVLYSPLEALARMGYRYCRNDQCGSADDIATAGNETFGRLIEIGEGTQSVNDTVESWMWLEKSLGPATVASTVIRSRGADFIAGVELQPYFHPSWTPRYASALKDVRSLNANWVVLTPTWVATRGSPPVLESVLGYDPLWTDTSLMIENAHTQDLNVALYPTMQLPLEANEWWQSAPRDFAWWVSWFDRYRNFILYHADLAQQGGAQALILGGEQIAPALPGAMLSADLPSGVPADAEIRWRELISEVRDHYRGTLMWAYPLSTDFNQSPPFLDAVDSIYLLWSAALTNRPDALEGELHAEAARLLDEFVQPFQWRASKPIVIAVAYPSADGGITGCLPDPLTEGGCLPVNLLSRPNADIPSISLDLEEQVEVYNALLVAINERDYIHGFISRGYYLPAILHDKSISVHGKPAGNVLWYWFPRFLGIAPP